MHGRQRQIIESYQRVKTFLEVNPAPAPASYTEQKRVLDEVLAEVTGHSSAQVFGLQSSQAESRRQLALVRQLRSRHMRPIVRIARFAIQPDPGIAKQLQMPRTNSVVQLLAASKAMREAAAPYKDTFVKNGLTENFLEAFADAETALGRTIITRAVSVGTHVGASAGMKERLRRGREAVDALDSIVQNAFEGNAVVLAAWNVAKRVKALPGGGRIAASAVSATQPDTTPEAA